MFSHLSSWKPHKCVLNPIEKGSFFKMINLRVTCLGSLQKLNVHSMSISTWRGGDTPCPYTHDVETDLSPLVHLFVHLSTNFLFVLFKIQLDHSTSVIWLYVSNNMWTWSQIHVSDNMQTWSQIHVGDNMQTWSQIHASDNMQTLHPKSVHRLKPIFMIL